MDDNGLECVDVGSENCPCFLALTGDCLVCSRLQGKDICDCEWSGVCIYNEFIQGNRKVNNPRTDIEAEIVYKKYYLDDLLVFGLKVGKGFAIKSIKPGSYVFLREKDSLTYYGTPLCVMHSNIEDGIIAVAIKLISSKTKTLSSARESLMVRGIYRSGLLGSKAIVSKHYKDKKVLIVAKGIGLAPAILAANYLYNHNNVDMIVDREKISEDLMGDYLEEGNGTIKFMNLNEEKHRSEIGEILNHKQYEGVVLLASDHFLDLIGNIVRENLPQAKLAISNNFRMCCGEGICGACTITDKDGKTFKMCKCNKKVFDNGAGAW